MKKTVMFYCGGVIAVLGLSGCVYTPVINQADLQKVDFQKLPHQKFGMSCVNVLFGFIPLKRNASVIKAAYEAGISKVSYVETYFAFYGPIGYKNCIMVYGE